MDSKQVLARFEAERQALAVMDHPNIAKVFDGGMTEQGRPYFVMEYVKGIPVTEYCDQARLSLKERLNLFIPVCQAVQHAHHKGIVHRDLKPSNILICLYDGKPVPKVIDFGLATAMHQSLTDQSIYTGHGVMVGTPLYMSPEPAEHNNLDIDTRTDIYSLGVVLYELLTGSTPLERQQLKQAAIDEVLRLIKEVEPPRPSVRLSSSATLPNIAAQRSIDPKQRSRSLAGDLDWIVMKSLEKERTRRYETATGLARDIERFLNDEVVEACPPSRIYQLKKLIRKNQGKVVAASAVLIALVIGIIGTTWGLFRATSAKQRDMTADLRIRTAACWLALELGSEDLPAIAEGGYLRLGSPPHFREFIKVAVRQVSPDQRLFWQRQLSDLLIVDLKTNGEAGERVAACTAIVVLTPDQIAFATDTMVQLFENPNLADHDAQLDALAAIAGVLDDDHVASSGMRLISLIKASGQRGVRDAAWEGLVALEPRLAADQIAWGCQAILGDLDGLGESDYRNTEVARWGAMSRRVESAMVANYADRLLSTLRTSKVWADQTTAVECFQFLAPRIDLQQVRQRKTFWHSSQIPTTMLSRILRAKLLSH